MKILLAVTAVLWSIGMATGCSDDGNDTPTGPIVEVAVEATGDVDVDVTISDESQTTETGDNTSSECCPAEEATVEEEQCYSNPSGTPIPCPADCGADPSCTTEAP